MRSLSERVLPLTVAKAYEMFIQEQQFRGNSRETLAYYKITLNMFMDFCGRDLDIDDLDVMLFKSYQLHLSNTKDIKRVSVRTYSRAVRVFYRYLYNEDVIDIRVDKLKLIKSEKEVILPLSDSEVKQLLNCFDDTVLGVRDKTICMLMLDCGLRRSEVINLKLSDVNFINNTILVNGKGSKQRIVPFGSTVRDQLLKYRSIIDDNTVKSFFLNNDFTALTSNAIKMMFTKLKERSGISRIYPHLLRHTFATNYIFNGGNLEVLRVLLGHSSINITQVYIHLASQMHLINDKYDSHLDSLM